MYDIACDMLRNLFDTLSDEELLSSKIMSQFVYYKTVLDVERKKLNKSQGLLSTIIMQFTYLYTVDFGNDITSKMCKMPIRRAC